MSESPRPYLCPNCRAVVGLTMPTRSHCHCCRVEFSKYIQQNWDHVRWVTAGAYSLCESLAASGHGKWHLRKMTSAGKKLGGGIDTEGLCGWPPQGKGWDLEVGLTKFHLETNTCKKCLKVYEDIHGIHHDAGLEQRPHARTPEGNEPA